jgi:hypothetical protein
MDEAAAARRRERVELRDEPVPASSGDASPLPPTMSVAT